MPGDFLTVDEIAEMFKVAKSTVYAWKDKMGLPYVKLGKRLLRFEREAIIEWARKNAKTTGSESASGSSQNPSSG